MIECVFVLSKLREKTGIMSEIEHWVDQNTDAGWSHARSFINGVVFHGSVIFNCEADAIAFMLRYGDLVAYTQPNTTRAHSKN